MPLSSVELVLIITSILVFSMAMFVAVLLFYYYRITQVFDYLLICIIFVFGAIYYLLYIFLKINRTLYGLLFHIQVLHFLIISIQLLFFIYAVRVKWYHPPKLLVAFAFVWYIILFAMISQYQLVNLPTASKFSWLKLIKNESETKGGAYQLSNGTIILGWGYDILLSLYLVFTFSFVIYIYLTMEFGINNKSIQKLRKTWLVAEFLYILPDVVKIPYDLSLLPLPYIVAIKVIFTFLAMIFVSYIAIWHSEGLLLSSIQLLRAVKLYNLVKNQEIKKENVSFGMKGIIEYIQLVTVDRPNLSNDGK